jgi:hypothetical protein
VGLSRSGTLFLIGLLALIGLSLHPVAGVESFVGVVFAPARVLAELALPLRFVGAKRVQAAELETLAAAEGERARSREVLLAAQAASMPAEAALMRGRALVGAHVIGREEKNADRVLLRYPVDSGISAGMPVVCGDVFVGRVIEVDPRERGQCRAELVTARGFRVGAVVDGGGSQAPVGGARFVVGGVLGDARDRRIGLHIAAAIPSDPTVTRGDLRVAEDESAGDGRLADGFRLGRLEPVVLRGMDPKRPLLGVLPLLDYESGLGQVAIVCPPQMSTAGPVLAIDPFDEDAWMDARVLLAGDPSPRRGTRKLAVSGSGVREGAALSVGARFIGRVGSVSTWSADARLLADAGVSFHAMARIEGVADPFALGLLVSQGVEGDEVAFAWAATIPLGEGEGEVAVEVWTAAGEPDVPPGLLVGTTVLPRGSGPFVLKVRVAQDVDGLLHCSVWRERRMGKP